MSGPLLRYASSGWSRAKSSWYCLRRKLLKQDSKFCPVCGRWSPEFSQYGVVPRKNARCDNCGALERHRFAWLYFQKNTDLFDQKKKTFLHMAPESCFESRFRRLLKGDYITADLNDPHAMVKMDLSSIPYSDQTLDVFYCSHVLEYVPDDQLALREIFRVLNPEGWAIIMVSITAPNTTSNAPTDSQERCRLYGDERFRMYGPDYVNRIRDAGFTVNVSRVADLVREDEATYMGLTPASGEIAYCTKRLCTGKNEP